jgi:cytochrome b561
MSASAWLGFFILVVGIPVVGYLMAAAQGHQAEVEREWEVQRIKEYWDPPE